MVYEETTFTSIPQPIISNTNLNLFVRPYNLRIIPCIAHSSSALSSCSFVPPSGTTSHKKLPGS